MRFQIYLLRLSGWLFRRHSEPILYEESAGKGGMPKLDDSLLFFLLLFASNILPAAVVVLRGIIFGLLVWRSLTMCLRVFHMSIDTVPMNDEEASKLYEKPGAITQIRRKRMKHFLTYGFRSRRI